MNERGFGATERTEGGAVLHTNNTFIFDWLPPFFLNYFQSVMSHCGGRIKRDNVAGGKEKGEVLFMQTEVLKGLWAGVRGIIGRFWWVFRPHCGG